jgi:hypothetical protein
VVARLRSVEVAVIARLPAITEMPSPKYATVFVVARAVARAAPTATMPTAALLDCAAWFVVDVALTTIEPSTHRRASLPTQLWTSLSMKASVMEASTPIRAPTTP